MSRMAAIAIGVSLWGGGTRLGGCVVAPARRGLPLCSRRVEGSGQVVRAARPAPQDLVRTTREARGVNRASTARATTCGLQQTCCWSYRVSWEFLRPEIKA